MIELPLSLQIFQRHDGHKRQAYEFTMPGIAISGLDLPVEFRDDRWYVTQDDDSTPGGPITASAESLTMAVLALIAARMGYRATFEPIEDDEP